MLFSAHTLPYRNTAAFTAIVVDYLDDAPALKPFYAHRPNAEGVRAAVEAKRKHAVNREVLVSVLKKQYANITQSEAVAQNIESLLSPNTFTVCTAHQPNLATGPLYFVYKIIHVIKLADELSKQHPGLHFVPVYYMGSEDADLEELNHFTVDGKRYTWNTPQTGAVGRMACDKDIQVLLDELASQLSPYPFGSDTITLLRKYFITGTSIQEATFRLVHELFAAYGLVVLIPDNPSLKKLAIAMFEQEIFAPISSSIVEQTSAQLAAHYNVQAQPRDINLFYLKDNTRERVIRTEGGFSVNGTTLRFTEDQMREELTSHPERFSPNVILRGLFQEMILPNIAFVGGGGEVAYWLQLKDLFMHYGVPFPAQVLRNSFLIVEKKWQEKIAKLHFGPDDFFEAANTLLARFSERLAQQPLKLNGKMEQAEAVFDAIRLQAEAVDPTLSAHVAALKTISLKKLAQLEQKMLRAEKRKHGDAQRQIEAIKGALFPGGLQERVESFLLFYAKWGPQFIQELYHHSLALEQQFIILEANGAA